MFLKFDGILYNQGSIMNIKRIPVKEEREDAKQFAIEVNLQGQAPAYEFFLQRVEMERRFSQLEELIGCSQTGGL